MDRTINNPTYESLSYNTINPNQNLNNREHIYHTLNKKYKLPKDWIELFDEESQKPYYACLLTKHTQWLHPGIPIGTMMENGLPYGWDTEYDPITKQNYFINHLGRYNTWSPPIKQRKYKGENYIW